jgi:hypothetical protein
VAQEAEPQAHLVWSPVVDSQALGSRATIAKYALVVRICVEMTKLCCYFIYFSEKKIGFSAKNVLPKPATLHQYSEQVPYRNDKYIDR